MITINVEQIIWKYFPLVTENLVPSKEMILIHGSWIVYTSMYQRLIFGDFNTRCLFPTFFKNIFWNFQMAAASMMQRLHIHLTH